MFLFGIILFANKSFCASLHFVDEFNGHLDSLRVYATASAMASLRMGEEDEKLSSLSVTHESKIEPIAEAPDRIEETLWHVQRGIEKLLEENHPFETFKAVVHSLKRFGDEIENPDFWAMAGQVYLETEIDLRVRGYEGENHWQTWFRMHFSGTKTPIVPGKEDVLGCLLYPVRHTTMHCKDVWKCNPLVFYQQSHSANYGNSYARIKVVDFLKARRVDDEEEGIDVLNTSSSMALRSPFNESFVADSDMNKLLWASFADNHFKYGLYFIPADQVVSTWQREASVLRNIKHPTGESLFYLAQCLLNINNESDAISLFIESASRGFEESKVYLSSLSHGSGSFFTIPETKFFELSLEKEVIYSVYKDIFGLKI